MVSCISRGYREKLLRSNIDIESKGNENTNWIPFTGPRRSTIPSHQQLLTLMKERNSSQCIAFENLHERHGFLSDIDEGKENLIPLSAHLLTMIPCTTRRHGLREAKESEKGKDDEKRKDLPQILSISFPVSLSSLARWHFLAHM